MRYFQLSLMALLILILAVVPMAGCMSASEDEDWENKYRNLKIENTVLTADMETMKADIDYLNSALEYSKADYSTLQATSKKLQTDYDVIQTQYNTLRTEYSSLKANYNSLMANYDTLQALYNDVINKLAEAGTTSFPVSTHTIIESYIDGTFEGWDGDTLFKLRNGQIWEQASYSYIYHYAYSPEVLIYSTSGGYKMVVDGVSETIYVRRLK